MEPGAYWRARWFAGVFAVLGALPLLDIHAQFVPDLFNHLFGIIQQGVIEIRRQNNSSGKYWPGQAASPGFIAAGF
jgi:hypothetical protein